MDKAQSTQEQQKPQEEIQQEQQPQQEPIIQTNELPAGELTVCETLADGVTSEVSVKVKSYTPQDVVWLVEQLLIRANRVNLYGARVPEKSPNPISQ